MGIKGIYRELGPGKRVALSKLAADSFVNENRPFRLAIDFAIWQYQNQAAQGGTNPAIRTLFYRLTRLLGTPIEPIFVFDGPKKPAFKRNKRSGRGCSVAAAQAKKVIRLFGFTVHDAPGEAEAECALLQQHGIVDAVLSEDVDTIMFGCTRTLRNWTAEGKGSTPTHVSLYDVKALPAGLDREGMVLVALMSGGDYLPEGVPGCGVKVACEAAKAGFGSVCQLKSSDENGIRAWRESLVHELRTNENGFFRTRHKALAIPDDFPNFEILRYYTHPVVSTSSALDSIREKFRQKQVMQLEGLREFTRETFDWDYRIGAIKFIRVLGQALLVNNMLQEKEESEGYVKRISSRRNHFSTDSTPELRVSYVPQEVVPIDLSKEVDEELTYDRNGLALNSDDEFEVADGLDSSSRATSAKIFDPSEPNLAWILEAVAKKSVPEAVQEWKAAQEAKAAKAAKKAAPKKTKAASAKSKKPSGMVSTGTLHQYMQVSKATETNSLQNLKKNPKPTGRSPRSTTPRRLRVPSPLEPSKPPTTSSTGSPTRQRSPWTLPSSQEMPRTPPKPSGHDQQAILISSSPAGPAPSPSPRPRRALFGSQGLPGAARQSPSKDVAQGMRSGRGIKTTSNASKAPSGSQELKMKQTSLDIFTTKVTKPATSSQPQASRRNTTSSQPPITSQLKTSKPSTTRTKPTYQSLDSGSDFDSDSDDLAPLSSFLSAPAPTSPSKRRQNTSLPTTRSPSPSPVRKKKLLVPRTSAVGFFKEVEVDEDERDELLEREASYLQKRGVTTGVTRLSDAAFVDLTGDD